VQENKHNIDQFSRFKALISTCQFEKINNSNILLIGVGGVGSFVFEALVRSGFSNITIVDYDTIDITNLNRQIMTNLNNIGSKKVDVLEERALSINKDIKITKNDSFITKNNIDSLNISKYDYIIDCCDTVETKKEIIKNCLEKKIKFITCMGTANKFEPNKFEIIDIRKTSYDPLAKKLRKWINDEKIKGKVLCCSSTEKPIKNKEDYLGSTSFVPPAAGLLIASYIVKDIIK